MNTRRVDESIRLLDEQIAEMKKTMKDINKQLEQQLKAKQEIMVLVDAMTDD